MFLARKLLCILSVFLFNPLISAQSKPETLNLTFTTIDVPGAMNTVVTAINTSGEMVGYWYNPGPKATGFLLSGGNFTFFEYPGSGTTEPFGINDSGLISGTAFLFQNTASVGFIYDGTTFTTIRVPARQHTVVYGVNDAGAIVGGDGGASANQAFELAGSRFRNVTPPPGGWITAVATRINNSNEIVGLTTAAATNGFAFKQGKFQTVTFPGSGTLTTTAWGVNDSGIIVGTYSGCSPCTFHGFVLMNGRYLSIDYPGAEATYIDGINNAGQLVGSYTFDQQTFHGFVTTPVITPAFERVSSTQ